MRRASLSVHSKSGRPGLYGQDFFFPPCRTDASSFRLTSLPSNDGLAVQQLESLLLYKNDRSSSS